MKVEAGSHCIYQIRYHMVMCAKIRVVGIPITTDAAPMRVPIVQTIRRPDPVIPPAPPNTPVATARRIAAPATALVPAVAPVGTARRIAAPVIPLAPVDAPAATR